MQLTGKQIVEKGILTNVSSAGIQQQGVDVRLKNIKLVTANDLPFIEEDVCGFIPKEGKTQIPKYTYIVPIINNEVEVYMLNPGYYEVEFEEGCKMPSNCAMYFKTRSSLVRCGADIRSGQFDGGFKTENMGAFMKVEVPIRIERGARIAQAIINETYMVSDEYLYDGQWQNDKQRNV